MTIRDILTPEEYTLLLDKYDEAYIEGLDETNFNNIYNLFRRYNFDFINDIIIRYLEIFTLDESYVEDKILLLAIEYGDNYKEIISKKLNLLDTIIEE